MKITKEEMAKKAVSLFYTNGYEHTTIEDICSACKVTKGSFYHHFRSKEDLLPYIYIASPVRLFEEQEGKGGRTGSPKERLWNMFKTAFEYTVNSVGKENMKNLWEMDLLSGNNTLSTKAFTEASSIPKETVEAFKSNIEEAREKGEIHSSLPAEELLFAYFSAMFGISVNWSYSKEDSDVISDMKRAFDVIFR